MKILMKASQHQIMLGLIFAPYSSMSKNAKELAAEYAC